MEFDEHLYDLTVIGGGPVGMFATFYASMRNLDTQLIESLPELGGQVAALYPEKVIHDVAGFVPAKGAELISNLKQQLFEFKDKLVIRCDEEVLELEKQPDETFVLKTSKRMTHTRSVLVAIGSGAFAPRPLAVGYDHDLDNQKVFYFVKQVADFANKEIAIAGGGDAAIDWALTLEPVAKRVHLIHRRNKFRGLEASVDRLKASSVDLVTPYNIKQVIDGPDTGLNLNLQLAKSEEVRTLTVDSLLVNYGFTSDNHILKEWGLPLERRSLVVDENMETAISGIYGIGDAVTYPGKVKLISAGFGEAPTAINHLAEALYPERKQPLHSTSIA
ncbi:NAD(P)/FAD-dependent oxidoreductase [Lentilactobacillus hilgardii]|nr:NAD(P)/FAD-dependent oxidoreductase [Lentilactobacillus hilgardii]MCV3740053.1 NAD(P)/FAD-dependent oxidoreductase [Lentilactobacillus hilgardii]